MIYAAIKKNIQLLDYFTSAALLAAGILFLMAWFRVVPVSDTAIRALPLSAAFREGAVEEKVDIKGSYVRFSGLPSALPGVWTGFRGKNGDNVSLEAVPLKTVPGGPGFPVKWSVKLGEGYAGAAVNNGCVYVLDYDNEKQSDALRCFSLDDGREIWRRSYRIPIKRNHGYSRAVPAVSDKYAVSMGPKGQVMCVDALSGDFKWGLDLEAEFKTSVPLWYSGQCPLIDSSTAVLAPGGSALLAGVDLETGKVAWQTPNSGNFEMSHSSVIPMTFFNKRMYVYCAIGGMTGVSAEDEDRGSILWQTEEWTHAVICPSPVKVLEDRILVTAGYGAGSMMFQVSRDEKGFFVKKLFSLEKSVFACEQQTPVFYKGRMFTVLPGDAGELNHQLVCASADGKILWKSGMQKRFGLGPFVIADDKIFVLDDNGTLTIAEAGSDKYSELASVKVLKGKESWGPIAVAAGRMILRDYNEMVCLDLNRK